jgi:anaerobic ribonucleoside-triphosphate reductase activating protein
MGGDQNLPNLNAILQKIREYGIKTCLYSGEDDVNKLLDLIPYLDYLKIGSYRENLGALNSKMTNQKFFKIQDGIMTDMTHLFHSKRGDAIF